MKASFIKYEKDYQLPKLLGMNIEEIKEPEEIDKKTKIYNNSNTKWISKFFTRYNK